MFHSIPRGFPQNYLHTFFINSCRLFLKNMFFFLKFYMRMHVRKGFIFRTHILSSNMLLWSPTTTKSIWYIDVCYKKKEPIKVFLFTFYFWDQNTRLNETIITKSRRKKTPKHHFDTAQHHKTTEPQTFRAHTPIMWRIMDKKIFSTLFLFFFFYWGRGVYFVWIWHKCVFPVLNNSIIVTCSVRYVDLSLQVVNFLLYAAGTIRRRRRKLDYYHKAKEY